MTSELSTFVSQSVGQFAQAASNHINHNGQQQQHQHHHTHNHTHGHMHTQTSSAKGSSSGSSVSLSGSGSSQPRSRVVLFKQLTDWYHLNHRYRLLLLGLTDGFQILDVTSTKQIRIIAAYSDAPVHQQIFAPFDPYQQQAQPDESLLNQSAAASTPIGIIQLLTHPYAFGSSSGLPSNCSSTPFYGSLLAVCSGEDRPNFPRSLIKIFSLTLGKYVHLLRFKSKIFGVHVHPSSRCMVVSLENELYVYSIPKDGHSLNFDCVWSSRILPNPSIHILQSLQSTFSSHPHLLNLVGTLTLSKDEWSVVAVNSRWVAYCPHDHLPNGIEPASKFINTHIESHHSSLPTSGSNESLSTVAKGIASGLYNLGGMGKLAVANYLAGDSSNTTANGHTTNSRADSSIFGTVIIRDIVTQRVIASIRAHPNTQITHIAFDRSGTLLATAPVDGQYIHIYQIVMVPAPVTVDRTSSTAPRESCTDHSPLNPSSRRPSIASHSPSIQPMQPHTMGQTVGTSPHPPLPRYHTRFLYRLFRGVTHAAIRDIAFSLDSKYVSIISSKGTTHIFALNPILGGDMSVQTHGPTDLREDNSLIQQMVAKVNLLQQQSTGEGNLYHSTHSTLPSLTCEQLDAQSALDTFLYQPRVLSSIWRIKPNDPPTLWSGIHFQAPAYQPVIATFDRLTERTHSPAQGTGGGSAANPIEGNHLLLSTWNDILEIHSVTANMDSSSHTTSFSSSFTRPKAIIHVDPISSFDLHPNLVNNAMHSQGSVTSTSPSTTNDLVHPISSSHSRLQSSVNHPISTDRDDDAPTVRILTKAGQEDDPPTESPRSRMHQHGLYANTIKTGASSTRIQAFFQQLDSDYTLSPSSSPLTLPTQPITIPRTITFTDSPILSSINRPVETPPILPSSNSNVQLQGSRWLSQVELRTYHSMDVPLWASPQFHFKTYLESTGVPPSLLFAEQAGSKPMVIGMGSGSEKVEGNRHSTPSNGTISSTPSSNSSSTSLDSPLTAAVSAALCTSVLDDAAFVANLQSSSVESFHRSRPNQFDTLDQQSSHRLFEPTGLDAAYFNANDAVTSSTIPSTLVEESSNLSDSLLQSSHLRSVPLTSSAIFHSSTGVSGSEILFAPLPSSNSVEDSIIISATQSDISATSAVSSASPPIEEIDASTNPTQSTGTKAKKGKKKH